MVSQLQSDTCSSNRRFLRLADVKNKVGLGRSAIYEKVQRGEFPKPVNLGARAVAWLSDEIDEWIDSRIRASRHPKRGK